MNKRKFLKNSAKLAATASLSMSGFNSLHAQGVKGYQLIKPPINTRSSDKIEVLEYFWFGCPHCFAFEPSINRWAEKKPDYVEFIREAPPLNPSWESHSRAFYAAEVMGVTEQFFDPMFNRIHVEKRSLSQARNIAKFSGELGIDANRFLEVMNSFAVTTRINQAMRVARASRVTGVPSIVINGKYLTGSALAGGHEGILRVIDERVAEEYSLL